MSDDQTMQSKVFYSREVLLIAMNLYFGYNLNKDEAITAKEFADVGQSKDSKADVKQLMKDFKDLDLDKNGKIDFAEFFAAFLKQDQDANYSLALVSKQPRDYNGEI